MIKVCHITSAHGVEDIRIFHKECVSLADAGYGVYLVEKGQSYDKAGVHIVGFGEAPNSRLLRIIIGAKVAYNKARSLDCDIYHLHDPELLPYALKLKKEGKKVIFDSHENYADQIKAKPYLPKTIAKYMGTFYSRYEAYVLKRIDALIHTCTKYGKDPYQGKCPLIAVIYNLPKLSEVYEKYDPSISKMDNSICYVGSLSHERGITSLIEAAKMSDCKLSLAGSFASEEYQKKVQSMDEYSCVNYVGVLNRKDVVEFIQTNIIGMATLLNVGQYNQDDSLPTKVYEYMALQMPVILSKSPYNERTMRQLKIGICVNPSDPNEIAKAIKHLLENPKMMKEMGQNGRNAIKTELNWEKEKEKLLQIYNDVIK